MRISIDSRLEEVRKVGENLQAFCLDNGFLPEDADFMELAIVEAVNNVIIHGYDARPGGLIALDMELKEDQLVFTIKDQGKPYNPIATPPDSRDESEIDPLDESGRGLKIIQAVMDQVEYFSRDGHNIMVLTKKRTSA